MEVQVRLGLVDCTVVVLVHPVVVHVYDGARHVTEVVPQVLDAVADLRGGTRWYIVLLRIISVDYFCKLFLYVIIVDYFCMLLLWIISVCYYYRLFLYRAEVRAGEGLVAELGQRRG